MDSRSLLYEMFEVVGGRFSAMILSSPEYRSLSICKGKHVFRILFPSRSPAMVEDPGV